MITTRVLYFAFIYFVCIKTCQATCDTSPWTQWALCAENTQEYRAREAQPINECNSVPCNQSTIEYRAYQCPLLKTPDVDQVIQTIRNELLSLDPNITTIADLATKGSSSDRLSMSRYYKAAYGSDLTTDLSEVFPDNIDIGCWLSIIGGTTNHVTTALERLIRLGNSDHVSSLLITNDNQELEKIQLQYKHETGETLDDAILQNFVGDEAKILRSLASAQRDENGFTNLAAVEGDTYDLKQAASSSDTDALLRILGAKDATHLNSVFNQYKSTYGRWVQYHIRRKVTGSAQACFLNIVDYISDGAKFCAVKVFFALGLAAGTTLDEDAVETNLIDCAKVDICSIAIKYQEIYNRNLADDVAAYYQGPCAQLLVPLTTIIS